MPADQFERLRDAELGSLLCRFLADLGCFLADEFPELDGRQPVGCPERLLRLK